MKHAIRNGTTRWTRWVALTLGIPIVAIKQASTAFEKTVFIEGTGQHANSLTADRGTKMKSFKIDSISIVFFMIVTLLAEVGLAQDWGPNAYPIDDYTSMECFEATEGCDDIGHIEMICGEEYLCSAPHGSDALGAVEDEPTFRECVDQCFRDYLTDKATCDRDYDRDVNWCDRNASHWNGTCRYLAHQTWNLCITVAGADLVACQSGCGLGSPLKGIWKKIAK